MSNRLRKRVAQGAIMLLTSVLLVVGLGSSPAQAENNYKAWVWAQNPEGTYNAGLAETWSRGENIKLTDFHADGWGVRAQLQTLERSSSGYLYWKDHQGVCFDDTNRSNTNGGATLCDRNVAEGKTFRIHIWASKGTATTYHNYSPGIPA